MASTSNSPGQIISLPQGGGAMQGWIGKRSLPGSSLKPSTLLEIRSFTSTNAISARRTHITGISSPMELFDRDFPGHYLRLIKRVRTSVIALIRPVHGIRATLATTGVSRVTIAGDNFQTVVVRRDPELVALTSPNNASGVFELEQQSEMLLPFEAMGVATAGEFQMPKAANPFDYTSVADVLISIDYTALNDVLITPCSVVISGRTISCPPWGVKRRDTFGISNDSPPARATNTAACLRLRPSMFGGKSGWPA